MMNNRSNNRFLVAAVALPMLIALLFSIAFYPMLYMEMKDLPVAIVSEDEGVQTPAQTVNAGQTVLENIAALDAQNEVIAVTVEDDRETALEKAEAGDYAAVIVLPQDFTKKQLSMTSDAPEAPKLALYINQGNFGMIGTLMETAMTTMIEQMGAAMQPQIAAAFTQAGVEISADQLAYYDEPIAAEVAYIHPVSNMGTGIMSANGHALAAMLSWMPMLIATVMLYLYNRKHRVSDARASRRALAVQLGWGIVASATTALAVTGVITGIMGLDVDFGATFLYLWIAIFGFMMLILGVMRWLGFGGVVLAVLAMFLSMGTIYLPYEVLPAFWQHWIYPWAPVRIISEGLRDIFFLGGSWWNGASQLLAGLAVTGIVLSCLSLLWKDKNHA